jgi:hypothetical protein
MSSTVVRRAKRGLNNSASLAMFTAIRRASSRAGARFVERSAKVFEEVASRAQIGKAPPTVGLVVLSNPTPMSRPNMSRLMKVHNLAAQFDFQPVFRDSKLDNIRVFFLICQRLSATVFNHVTPAENQGAVRNCIFTPSGLTSALR